MKDTLVKLVRDFLSTHLKPGAPLLVGLSGGEDSSALFSLLLECRAFFPLSLHVAHFDHAWREESEKEALLLQGFVEGFALPFHTERAGPSKGVSNLEEKARDERFSFFQRVYQKIGAQGLLLAHQRGDQAETILKRLFEGAGLLSLGGMQACSQYETMAVWRPLLGASRSDIEKWNQGKKWVPFKDRTNLDPKFLRPRMRQELFPLLEQCFGKKVQHSLFRVGEELSLLRNSLEKKLESYVDQSEEGPLGSALPLMDLGILDPFERQETLRLFLKRHGVKVSSDVLKRAIYLLEEKGSGKKLDVSKGELFLEKGTLIWMRRPLKPFQGQVSLHEQGSDLIKVSIDAQPIHKERSLLSAYLKGKISYRTQNPSSCMLTSYDLLTAKDQKAISSYLAKNKIPSPMRKLFPFITSNNKAVDFDFCFNFSLKDEKPSDFSNIILKI